MIIDIRLNFDSAIQSENDKQIIFKSAINLKRSTKYISRIVKGIIKFVNIAVKR